MNKRIAHFSFWVITSICALVGSSVHADDCCNWLCGPFGAKAELRVAYYQPSSHKVRHIYGNGWTDYQLELSKDIACGFRGWVGVSGFSRKGHSIGYHDRTSMSLIPINFGLKYDYNFCNGVDVFVGGAACYSSLHLHDHSGYVKEHTNKWAWGGLLQTGVKYDFCSWGYVSAFFDYMFQKFNFHDSYKGSFSGSSYYYESEHIERCKVNLNGFKLGVGLGLNF